MISDNQMDEFFNGRFRDYPSAVPKGMWDRIVEKKKRDRMIWLFFLRLFAIIILSLALAGGYFTFNQKKSSSAIGMDSTKINHAPFITDTSKAIVSNLPAGQDQMRLPQIKESNKKTNKKEKTQINYLNKLDHAKRNTQNGEASSKFNNISKAQSGQTDLATPTDSYGVKENNTEDKKDSAGKRPLVKAVAPDIKASSPNSIQNKDSKKSKIKNNSNNRKWFLDLFVSPDYPFVSPHEREQSKLSYSIGIKLNRSLGERFSIKTGIQYSQVNVVGNDSLFGGTTMHLMRLDLPILVGYSVGNEKLKTTFNGGAILNLYSWLPGNNPSDFFKTNTGLSLYLGVNFETKINEKFSLFGEPYYRYQITSMTVSSVAIMKFIDIVGINIGARYYFGNKHSGR
jgi:hypothetical protein